MDTELLKLVLHFLTTELDLEEAQVEHMVWNTHRTKLFIIKNQSRLDLRISFFNGVKYIPSRKGFNFHVKSLPDIVSIFSQVLAYNKQ